MLLREALDPARLASCDATVLDYVAGTLQDEDFEWGEDALDALEAVGPLLVEGGVVASEAEALALLRRLLPARSVAPVEQQRSRVPLRIGGLTIEESGEAARAERAAGCVVVLHDCLADTAKLEKRRKKEERAAFLAHEARLEASRGSESAPTIVRNLGSGGSRDIHLENISVSNGGEELISGANLTLAHGRRYGLIGRNGTGKTTLLRAFAGRQLPGIPPALQVLHVEQEVTGDETSALDCVLACDAERAALLQEERLLLADTADKSSEAATRLRQVYDRMEAIDAAGAPSRAACILAGLSFGPAEQARPTKSFSGGWRMRLALARALFVSPDVLLLDEPTNHLDLHAVLWLAEYLVSWPGTVLIVSHARDFLNCVCTDIVHLQSRTLTVYRGDYDCFEGTRAERARTQARAADAQAAKRAHLQRFIDRFRVGTRAAMAQSRIKALARMAEVSCLDEDPETVFRFPEPAEASGSLISFNDVSFSYSASGAQVFRRLSFGLDAGSRVAIVGPNGIGKSTLLGLVGGSLSATEGYVTRSTKARIAVFAQHHVDGLDLSLSPLGVLVRAFPGVLEQELRSHLGSFGISGPLALQPLYTLSGGQKSRVQFAKMTWLKPNLLLLDEPTNHLDLDAIDALAEGLATWSGGVLLVSHDAHFISACCDNLWACEAGQIAPFEGTFEDYKKTLHKAKA